MTATSPSHPDVVQPDHPGYDDARRAWNLAAQQWPAAVVTARSVEDVRAALAFARRHRLRVAVQGSGHRAAALPELDGALLLRTELGSVDVDPARGRVRVGAGATWRDVLAACAPHGLVPPCGSSGSVGVVGYALGGGMSLLGRRLGLAANHVAAAELVTADGTLVRADGETHPELLWALRGGGGGLGVVTALELAVERIETLFAGTTFWPAEEATAVYAAWAAWAERAPDSVTTTARILRLPPLPDVPEPLRGRPVVAIDGVATGGEAEVAELRALATPLLDTWAPIGVEALADVHGDPPQPVPASGHGALLRELTPAGIEALVSVAGAAADCALMSVELRQLGGALGRAPADAGVVGRLDAAFTLFAVGLAADPQMDRATTAQVDRVLEALRPWHAERSYLNYCERGGTTEDVLAPAEAARLRAARATWDPTATFVVSHA